MQFKLPNSRNKNSVSFYFYIFFHSKYKKLMLFQIPIQILMRHCPLKMPRNGITRFVDQHSARVWRFRKYNFSPIISIENNWILLFVHSTTKNVVFTDHIYTKPKFSRLKNEILSIPFMQSKSAKPTFFVYRVFHIYPRKCNWIRNESPKMQLNHWIYSLTMQLFTIKVGIGFQIRNYSNI